MDDLNAAAARIDVYTARGVAVMLDRDAAEVFQTSVSALNQNVKRNTGKFTDEFSFKLTADETSELRSQIVTSNPGKAKKLRTPRVFTEKGVIMVATVLRTPRAITATQVVVRSFAALQRGGPPSNLPGRQESDVLVPREAMPADLRVKINGAIDKLVDAILTRQEQETIAEEARDLADRGLGAVKSLLDKPGIANEATIAETRRKLAEAAKLEAEAAGQRTENRERQLVLLIKELRFVMAAHHALQSGNLVGFQAVLDDMSGA